MSITLSAKNLQKTYKSRTVVKDVSLEIGHEVIGLLGPNGAGKTTSFYMIVGLVQPEQWWRLLKRRGNNPPPHTCSSTPGLDDNSGLT